MILKNYLDNNIIPVADYSPLNDTDNIKTLQDFIKMCYSSLIVNPNISDDTTITDFIKIIFRVNQYKYVTLWETMRDDYDPISNYDMTETEKIDNTVTGDSTNTTGEINNKNIVEHDTTNNADITNIHGVAPYDKEDKIYTETQDKNSNKNTVTGTETTTQKSDSRTDKSITNSSGSTTRELTRKGNIGVMSTQDLIKQSREIADFNFYKIVANDIISKICIGVYD